MEDRKGGRPEDGEDGEWAGWRREDMGGRWRMGGREDVEGGGSGWEGRRLGRVGKGKTEDGKDVEVGRRRMGKTEDRGWEGRIWERSRMRRM